MKAIADEVCARSGLRLLSDNVRSEYDGVCLVPVVVLSFGPKETTNDPGQSCSDEIANLWPNRLLTKGAGNAPQCQFRVKRQFAPREGMGLQTQNCLP